MRYNSLLPELRDNSRLERAYTFRMLKELLVSIRDLAVKGAMQYLNDGNADYAKAFEVFRKLEKFNEIVTHYSILYMSAKDSLKGDEITALRELLDNI